MGIELSDDDEELDRESSASHSVHPGGKKLRNIMSSNQKNRALLQVLHREVERLEEERIQLKCQNRKIARQLGAKAADLGLEAEDLEAIQEYTDALKTRRKMGVGKGFEGVIEQHENTILLQKALEEERVLKGEVQKDYLEVKVKVDEMNDEND